MSITPEIMVKELNLSLKSDNKKVEECLDLRFGKHNYIGMLNHYFEFKKYNWKIIAVLKENSLKIERFDLIHISEDIQIITSEPKNWFKED